MDLSQIFNDQTTKALSELLLAVITGGAAAVAKAVFSFLKSHTTAQQYGILTSIATDAVHAAEQGASAGFVKDKKQTAINIVNEALKNAGIKNITAEQIDAIVEAAVLREFNDTTSDSPSVVGGAESGVTQDADDTPVAAPVDPADGVPTI